MSGASIGIIVPCVCVCVCRPGHKPLIDKFTGLIATAKSADAANPPMTDINKIHINRDDAFYLIATL